LIVFFVRHLTVAEVISMLEDEEFQQADVFILPPEDATRSDEDSGPEDDDGSVDNLTGNQLRAAAEASLSVSGFDKRRLGADDCPDDDTNDHDEDCDLPLAEPCSTASISEAGGNPPKRRRRTGIVKSSSATTTTSHQIRPKKTVPPPREWVKRDLKVPDIPWSATSTSGHDRSPPSLFELFYDDELINYITEMTNLYAIQKSKKLDATPSEIRLVIAILLVSGYVPLVNRRMYWENSEDVHNAAVSSTMPVNRFEELLRYIHVCDNTNLDQETNWQNCVHCSPCSMNVSFKTGLSHRTFPLMNRWSLTMVAILQNNSSAVSRYGLVLRCGVLTAVWVIWFSVNRIRDPLGHSILTWDLVDL